MGKFTYNLCRKRTTLITNYVPWNKNVKPTQNEDTPEWKKTSFLFFVKCKQFLRFPSFTYLSYSVSRVESRKPLAKGLLSIFSLVICKKEERCVNVCYTRLDENTSFEFRWGTHWTRTSLSNSYNKPSKNRTAIFFNIIF